MYKGIINFKLSSFLRDNSLTAKLNFGEISNDNLSILNNLSVQGEVGVIICSAEMIQDITELINKLYEIKE